MRKTNVYANGLDCNMNGFVERDILYACDRRAFQYCNPACNRTSDIRHAKNFKLDGKIYTDE